MKPRLGKPVIRLLLFGILISLVALVIIRLLSQPKDDFRALRLLDLVDETGQLTDSFKEELKLKDKLIQQEHAGIKKANALPEPKPVDKARSLNGDVSGGINPKTYFRGKDVPDDVLAMNVPSFLSNYKNPCWYEPSADPDIGRDLRCLPYFQLIGVDKSGTTDLWFRMAQHPDFVTPSAVMGKETHWWSWRRFGFDIWVKNREIRHFNWYLQHFDQPAKKIERKVIQKGNKLFYPLITGEGSPTVFWDFTGWNMIPQNEGRLPETAFLTPHCIKHLTPDVKLIVIFRDPTGRLYSDYVFLDKFRSYHNVSVPGFHQEVQRSIAMLQHCFADKSRKLCLYDKELHMRIPVRLIAGMYDIFLEEWLKVFSPQQMLVLRNEDYSRNTTSHLKAIFRFLDLSPLTEAELAHIAGLPRVHETSQARKLGPMMDATRNLLNNFYSEYNKQLAERFQDPKFLWKD